MLPDGEQCVTGSENTTLPVIARSTEDEERAENKASTRRHRYRDQAKKGLSEDRTDGHQQEPPISATQKRRAEAVALCP